MIKMWKKNKIPGYTLAEMLITVMIVGLALPIIFSVLINSYSNLTKIENQENQKKYAKTVTPVIKSYGGVPLVRGGKYMTYDGDDFIRSVIWEFPSYEKAIEVLNTSVQVNPNYSKGYSTLGVVYIEMEEWSNAVNNLVLATAYNEKDAMSWYRLSSAYNKLGDCENAQEAARNATDYKKNFGGHSVELGISVWCNGKGNKIIF